MKWRKGVLECRNVRVADTGRRVWSKTVRWTQRRLQVTTDARTPWSYAINFACTGWEQGVYHQRKGAGDQQRTGFVMTS